MPAPTWAADRLAGVSEGDLVHVRRRVTTIDGAVNQSADSYLAVATGERNPDLLTGRGAGGHIARINAVSPVTEVQKEITARMPASPEAARLDVPEGALDVASSSSAPARTPASATSRRTITASTRPGSTPR